MSQLIGATRVADEDEVYCDSCGSDLTVEGSVTFVRHADAQTYYSNTFKCNACGDFITQTFERSKESRALWD